MVRLSVSALKEPVRLHPDVELPNYLDAELGAGILHIGLGQFAKAHLLFYLDSLLNQSPDDWRVIGVNLRSDKAKEQLAPQNFLYSMISQSAESKEARILGSLADVIGKSELTSGKFLHALLAPSIRIVSLTITEKGYYISNGGLNFDHPDIQADLRHPSSPTTAIGWLALGLKKRREEGTKPFTVMSLDNIRGNGRVLRQLVMSYCQRIDPELAAYVEDEVSFPSSMVDRIVPALDAEGRDLAAEMIGFNDEAPVTTEGFCQWVVEDNFTQGRPPWERVGVTLCHDIDGFESMKLKLLNGAHSSLAYLGVLLDLETVADCMSYAPLRTFIERLLRSEVMPEVDAPSGIDLSDYVAELIVRFRNPYLKHRCAQIAMDGSEKLPQRLLPVIEARLAKNQDIQLLSYAIAGWLVFLQSQTVIEDPIGKSLQYLAQGDPSQMVANLVGQSGVFGKALQEERFMQMVAGSVTSIQTNGARASLELLMKSY